MKLKKLKKITNNHLMLTSKTNGITIIALVITIIIIIILATITINITLGEGGLIQNLSNKSYINIRSNHLLKFL